MPRASQEAVNGIVTRMINNKLHDAEIADDPEHTMKPDVSKTQSYMPSKYQKRQFDNCGTR